MAVEIDVLEEMLNVLSNVVDFEESKLNGRLVAKTGVSEKLDELKQTYAGIDSLLVRAFCGRFLGVRG